MRTNADVRFSRPYGGPVCASRVPLLALLTFFGTTDIPARADVYFQYSASRGVTRAEGDPSEQKTSDWQIWLYRRGQAADGSTAGRWGVLYGNSAAAVMKELRADQKMELDSEKLTGKESTHYYFNPLGPIAVVNGWDRNLAERAFDLKGREIVMAAYAVAADYKVRNVRYQMGGDASNGGSHSDCSHFVNDVLRKAGINAPYVDTANIGWLHYLLVKPEDAKPGDIIVRRWFDPERNIFEGHMGIYTGDVDSKGRWSGVQMGVRGGAQTALWGPNGWFTNGWFDPNSSFQFYRFRQ